MGQRGVDSQPSNKATILKCNAGSIASVPPNASMVTCAPFTMSDLVYPGFKGLWSALAPTMLHLLVEIRNKYNQEMLASFFL